MSITKVYEDLCYTEMRVEMIKFVWKIRDYSKLDSTLSSSSFPTAAPEEVGKWHLELNKAQNIIDVVPETYKGKNANIIISLINNKCTVEKSFPTECKSGNRSRIWLSNSNFYLGKVERLLLNDQFTIVCEIKINLPHVNRSPPEGELPPCLLAEDLGELLASGTLSDVTITTKGGVELKAHKTILAARSAVFAAMFSNPMLEKETGIVQITDLDAEVVQAMLEFMYTGKYVSEASWAHNLLAAANKYQLEGLKVMCEETLGKALTLDNVMENLALAGLHSAARLKEHCISKIHDIRAGIFK